jgi:hypothetical protein
VGQLGVVVRAFACITSTVPKCSEVRNIYYKSRRHCFPPPFPFSSTASISYSTTSPTDRLTNFPSIPCALATAICLKMAFHIAKETRNDYYKMAIDIGNMNYAKRKCYHAIQMLIIKLSRKVNEADRQTRDYRF